ncbi:hypothetical protein VQ042_16450 [Aurantimonas sp. A2-1-M11]|uniref:hypothetical protein n=1 Tax=Aurantimonas sp. A2-1-M11 TaxID=3113712 RepID=UPI002F9594F6
MTKLFLPLLMAGVLLATPLAAQSREEVNERIEALQGDPQGFAEAFDLLTEAMRYGDPVTVSQLADYPLTVRANGEEYELLEAQDLVDNYDRLVMADTQQMVADQEFDELFVNAQGVMFADGALWMASICDDDACSGTHWGIIAINN